MRSLIMVISVAAIVAAPVAAQAVEIYADVEADTSQTDPLECCCECEPGTYYVHVMVEPGQDSSDVTGVSFCWSASEDLDVSDFVWDSPPWTPQADWNPRVLYATCGCQELPSRLGYFVVEYPGGPEELSLCGYPECGNMTFWDCAGVVHCLQRAVGAAFNTPHCLCPICIPADPSASAQKSWGAVKALYR